jgi:hypothetical protein
LLDTLQIKRVDEAVIVTGGVQPYDISIDTTGNVVMVSAVDYDGCTSTKQFILSSLTEAVRDGIKIYPNPASTEIYLDLIESQDAMAHLRIVSLHGQVLKQVQNAGLINISTLNEGVYILQIELAGGAQVNKRVLVLR